MADYTVTPGNVLSSTGASKETRVAAVAILAGQVLARDATGKMILHDTNDVEPVNVAVGVALHGSLPGQPITYARSDPDFQPGFTLVTGDTVIASANPGGMCPESDKAAGWFITQMGIATSTSKMKLQIVASGVAR